MLGSCMRSATLWACLRNKTRTKAPQLSFLGLELDTVAREVRLPWEKVQRLRTVLNSWRGRKACKKRDLLSLIGSLTRACRAVRPGRCYVRRLIDLSTTAKRLDQFVRLNREARADIQWWHLFLASWNGTAMMQGDPTTNPQVVLTSDASGSWGCVAFVGQQWFMLLWAGPPHYCQRAGPNRSGGTGMGTGLERQDSPSALRQLGCRRNCEHGILQEPSSYAN